jgi:predicted TIM-barrel fold metal-dependent hydrolase
MSEPIIDAHHHIWRLAETPWLNGQAVKRIFGDYQPLRRDYLAPDFMADVVPAGVVKSVYMQVNVAAGREIEEARWVTSQAAAHGFPHALSAFANLNDPGVGEVLDALMACSKTRAIRQQIHWHENEQYRFAPRPDVMNDAQWRRGLKELGKRKLMFELQVFAPQMDNALKLLRDFPEVTFVLQHCGMLQDKSAEGSALWRKGMKAMSACPNLMVKISGLGTFERSCNVASWRPIIEETIELYGAARCLFGSNFPIESMWTSYTDLVATVKACLSRCSEAERRAILHDTATRLYGL